MSCACGLCCLCEMGFLGLGQRSASLGWRELELVED